MAILAIFAWRASARWCCPGPPGLAVFDVSYPWGAAHVPRAGVADQRRQEIVSRALHGSCKPEPTPGRRRRRESRQPERSQHRV